jgi:DNA-binding XRE family transcriptional regulator
MKRTRTYSPYAVEAAKLLAQQIRLARRRRRWSQSDLAERAGIARATLVKLEQGDLNVSLGIAFEVAALVGVTLFHPDQERLILDRRRAEAESAVLPDRAPVDLGKVRDDF